MLVKYFANLCCAEPIIDSIGRRGTIFFVGLR